jgi:hypothetical protein
MDGSALRVILSAALCLGLGAHAQTPPHGCATGVHAIMAREIGAGDNLSVLVTIQNQILKAIPGSTSVAIPYNHNPSTVPQDIAAIDQGGITMQEYVREYVASCPDAKIVMFGYSLVRVPRFERVDCVSPAKLAHIYALGCNSDDGSFVRFDYRCPRPDRSSGGKIQQER